MAENPEEVITALEAQLAKTPRVTRPHEHATVAYRLGMAYSELPMGDFAGNLRKALAHYDVAAAIFDPRLEPAPHARVLNAAGAAHRGLGNRVKAAELFESASRLFEANGGDAEGAAALNNLGLVRAELGQSDLAVEAFDKAVPLFDKESADGRRGLVATLHNRGQAHGGLGTEDGFEAALADFEEAQTVLDPDEAPYHHGLVQHSIGVACTSLAQLRPQEAESYLKEAVNAFGESLRVFVRGAFPFQHALAKHNLGRAYTRLGGTNNLRRALAAFEDAVAVLDTRLHKDAWTQAYTSLEQVEKELAVGVPGLSRADHFAALLASVREEEREALLKERVLRLLAIPTRSGIAVAELNLAVGKLGEEKAKKILEPELLIVMEQPQEFHSVTLAAIVEAHKQLDDEHRQQADRALDQSIGGLGGVQRVHVRDFLYSLGWERPE